MIDAKTVNVTLDKKAIKGRLEYYHQGSWGTACDDNASQGVAKVFCRTVDLPYSNAEIITKFGGGQGKILFINL